MSSLDVLKKELHDLNEEIKILNNKKYKLNEEYIKEAKKRCENNIGKCYRKTIPLNSRSIDAGKTIYYIITDTKEIQYKMVGGSYFNEHQYDVLQFKYPYNNEPIPFEEDDVHIGNLEKCEKISKEDFLKAYSEVNNCWINKYIKQF